MHSESSKQVAAAALLLVGAVSARRCCSVARHGAESGRGGMGQDPGSLICGRALGKCPGKSKACKSWVQNIQVWRRAKKQSVGLNLGVPERVPIFAG